jgi:DedD protein
MNEQLKQRLVGAAVLVLLAVIVIPMILEQPNAPAPQIRRSPIPPKPEGDFSSRIIPLDPPETPLVEAQRAKKVPIEPPRSDADASAGTGSSSADGAQPRRAAAPLESQPATAAGQSGLTAWAVQLGSFSSAQNAVALRDRLRKKGYTAFVEKGRAYGSEITRVFVGPELARDQADKIVKKLYAETRLKGIVVRYPDS